METCLERNPNFVVVLALIKCYLDLCCWLMVGCMHNGATSPACLRPLSNCNGCYLQVNVDNYHEWIQLVAEFTANSLNSWQWASGSVYYLLGLWSRLVSSMPYLKGDAPSLLDTYVPKITKAYITSR
jgi:hypothetical protein